MATKRKPKTDAPKPPKNRARDAGEVVPLGVEVSKRHKIALDQYAHRDRRTKRVAAEQAIEALLGPLGLWPPPDEVRTDTE